MSSSHLLVPTLCFDLPSVEVFSQVSHSPSDAFSKTRTSANASPVAENVDGLRSTAIKDFQTRLVLLYHASNCPQSNAVPRKPCRASPCCFDMFTLLQHCNSCTTEGCIVPHCVSTRYLLSHYRQCQSTSCTICKPLNDSIERKRQRQSRETVIIRTSKKSRSHCDSSDTSSVSTEANLDADHYSLDGSTHSKSSISSLSSASMNTSTNTTLASTSNPNSTMKKKRVVPMLAKLDLSDINASSANVAMPPPPVKTESRARQPIPSLMLPSQTMPPPAARGNSNHNQMMPYETIESPRDDVYFFSPREEFVSPRPYGSMPASCPPRPAPSVQRVRSNDFMMAPPQPHYPSQHGRPGQYAVAYDDRSPREQYYSYPQGYPTEMNNFSPREVAGDQHYYTQHGSRGVSPNMMQYPQQSVPQQQRRPMAYQQQYARSPTGMWPQQHPQQQQHPASYNQMYEAPSNTSMYSQAPPNSTRSYHGMQKGFESRSFDQLESQSTEGIWTPRDDTPLPTPRAPMEDMESEVGFEELFNYLQNISEEEVPQDNDTKRVIKKASFSMKRGEERPSDVSVVSADAGLIISIPTQQSNPQQQYVQSCASQYHCQHCRHDILGPGYRYSCKTCQVDFCSSCFHDVDLVLHDHPLRPCAIASVIDN